MAVWPGDGSATTLILVLLYRLGLTLWGRIDLKTSKLTSRDVGQMDTYRRMFDSLKKPEGDNPTIGILLGTEIDETELKYSIMSECKRLFATKLLPYLPTKEELAFEIERARRRRAR